MRARRFTVHNFVVMPNHLHVLLTIPGHSSIEKAMQFIKGGFSYRANKELGFKGDIWQRGFSDVRVVDARSFEKHRAYIDQNPVKAGLAASPEEYPFSTAFLKKVRRSSGAKAPAKV